MARAAIDPWLRRGYFTRACHFKGSRCPKSPMPSLRYWLIRGCESPQPGPHATKLVARDTCIGRHAFRGPNPPRAFFRANIAETKESKQKRVGLPTHLCLDWPQ